MAWLQGTNHVSITRPDTRGMTINSNDPVNSSLLTSPPFSPTFTGMVQPPTSRMCVAHSWLSQRYLGQSLKIDPIAPSGVNSSSITYWSLAFSALSHSFILLTGPIRREDYPSWPASEHIQIYKERRNKSEVVSSSIFYITYFVITRLLIP